MARRKSEGNMFLDSQESANISANEKKPSTDASVPEKNSATVKSPQKSDKSPASPAKKTKSIADNTNVITLPGSVSDVLSILATTKETRQNGIAKSIYLDKDVHDKILALSQQSGIPFSKIINMLLKAAFRDSKA